MSTHGDFDRLQDFANEILRRNKGRNISDDFIRAVATKYGLLDNNGERTDLLKEHVIDLDLCDWELIKKSASESPWMPQEYCRNDWVVDVCKFLRDKRV